MKKIFLSLFFFSFLVSCRKDRVCECTNQSGAIVSQATYVRSTKREVKAVCISNSADIVCTVK
jgi:hypothetical protein